MSIHSITGIVNFNHLVNMVSARFLHCKITFFLLIIHYKNKCNFFCNCRSLIVEYSETVYISYVW